MAAPPSAGICADAAAYLKVIARRQLNPQCAAKPQTDFVGPLVSRRCPCCSSCSPGSVEKGGLLIATQAHPLLQSRCCCTRLMVSTQICGRCACGAYRSAAAASVLPQVCVPSWRRRSSSLSGPPSLAPTMVPSPLPAAGERAAWLLLEPGGHGSITESQFGPAPLHALLVAACCLAQQQPSSVFNPHATQG